MINQFPSLFIAYQASSLLDNQLYMILPTHFPNLSITFCPLELTNKKALIYLFIYLFIGSIFCLFLFHFLDIRTISLIMIEQLAEFRKITLTGEYYFSGLKVAQNSFLIF